MCIFTIQMIRCDLDANVKGRQWRSERGRVKTLFKSEPKQEKPANTRPSSPFLLPLVGSQLLSFMLGFGLWSQRIRRPSIWFDQVEVRDLDEIVMAGPQKDANLFWRIGIIVWMGETNVHGLVVRR